MNRLLKIFLQNYDSQEKEAYLTARFVLITIIFVLFLASATVLYAIYLHDFNSSVVFAQLLNLIIMLIALGLLIKGRYNIAVHLIFISVFTAVWAVIFLESKVSMLVKMDTIVFVLGFLTIIPVVSFKSRKPMVIYFLMNAVLFLIFNLYLKQTANLTTKEHVDYFMDNSVVMVFVFWVSFNLFTINQKTLSVLQKELNNREKAEKELLESKHQLSIHLKNTPVGAISWDTEFRVREWNPSAETIFGYSREEAMGKHVADLILPDEAKEQVGQVFQNVLAGRGGDRNINENLTKSGKRILCDWYNT